MEISHRMHLPASLSRRALGLVMLVALGIGCDATPRGRDAQAPMSYRVSEISVRMEVPGSGSPSISVQACKANVVGLHGDDILSVVDPLVGAAPESRCELRDVAGAARALRTRGTTIELEALDDVALELGGSEPV